MVEWGTIKVGSETIFVSAEHEKKSVCKEYKAPILSQTAIQNQNKKQPESISVSWKVNLLIAN